MQHERRVASPLGHATITVGERALVGRSKRADVARSAHGEFTPAPDRPDPVWLVTQDEDRRLADLVPLRHERMVTDPFTFFRGSAAIMAWDLSHAPHTDLYVQMCGDAHLANFGVYAAPSRELVFDINDFDETLPGPFEFDVKRLVASVVIAGRHLGLTDAVGDEAVRAGVDSYRAAMRRFATMTDLEVWYSRHRLTELRAVISNDPQVAEIVASTAAKAMRNTSVRAHSRLVEVADETQSFRNDPPILVRLVDLPQERTGSLGREIEQIIDKYRRSLPDHLKVLIERYEVLDVARKVVGVGSVGSECYIVLLRGRRRGDPFILQVKQAGPSVFEGPLPRSRHRTPGARVVAGQRLIQAASDLFLGTLKAGDGTSYYVRQFRDAKGSVDLESMTGSRLTAYSRMCGTSLARAHARSGDSVAIQGYLGKGRAFDDAMVAYSHRYADQNEQDYTAFRRAVTGH
jgi:uncharacterized protein (DUF2252 family)